MAALRQGVAEQGTPTAIETTEDAAPSTHETDFHAWAVGQIEALRTRDTSALDWDRLVEKFESLVYSPAKYWMTWARIAIDRMLTIERAHGEVDYRYCMEGAVSARYWMAETLMDAYPGMTGDLMPLLSEAWAGGTTDTLDTLVEYESVPRTEKANRRAELESGFPAQCPWEIIEIAGFDPRGSDPGAPRRGIWPGAVARRLNQELNLDFYDGGWTAHRHSGQPVERNFRPPDPRDLAPAPPTAQVAGQAATDDTSL